MDWHPIQDVSVSHTQCVPGIRSGSTMTRIKFLLKVNEDGFFFYCKQRLVLKLGEGTEDKTHLTKHLTAENIVRHVLFVQWNVSVGNFYLLTALFLCFWARHFFLRRLWPLWLSTMRGEFPQCLISTLLTDSQLLQDHTHTHTHVPSHSFPCVCECVWN